jgi:hypothetical protein
MKYILGLLIVFGFVGVASATDCVQGVCQQQVVQRQVVAHPQRVVEFVEVPAVQFIEVSHPQRVVVQRQVVAHPQRVVVERQVVVEKQVVHGGARVEKSVQRRGIFGRSVQRSVSR